MRFRGRRDAKRLVGERNRNEKLNRTGGDVKERETDSAEGVGGGEAMGAFC